jgi:hypothetical protein
MNRPYGFEDFKGMMGGNIDSNHSTKTSFPPNELPAKVEHLENTIERRRLSR